MNEYDDDLFFRDLVTRKAVVLNHPCQVVGKAEKYWDGEEDVYYSPTNQSPVKHPVLELSNGNALLALRGNWQELTGAGERLYSSMVVGVAALVKVSARNASAQGMELETGIAIMTSILRAQAAALEKR
jgi:hypothetical protein